MYVKLVNEIQLTLINMLEASPSREDNAEQLNALPETSCRCVTQPTNG